MARGDDRPPGPSSSQGRQGPQGPAGPHDPPGSPGSKGPQRPASPGRDGARRAIHVGDRAPDFTLPDRDGQPVTLRDFRGQTVVLYFYPRDHTMVCTAQACHFRDRHAMFRLANAVVIGVSSDTIAAHERFAQEHGLPFRLLADEQGRVRALYRVPRLLGLFPGRVTYVIDLDGIVRHVIKSHFSARRHIREALQAASLLSVGARSTPPRG